MSIEGPNGPIEGDLDDGKIGVITFTHTLESPGGSKRQHGPIRIVKTIDKSTVLLFQALVTNQVLKKVSISISRDGTEVLTMDLEDVSVVALNHYKETIHGSSDSLKLGEYEEVAFTYKKITWTHPDGGISAEDDWSSTK